MRTIRTIASVGCCSVGSGRSSTRTFPTPDALQLLASWAATQDRFTTDSTPT
ncbi:hypothetical protein J2X34_003706 [Rhodococcus sp. BE178]